MTFLKRRWPELLLGLWTLGLLAALRVPKPASPYDVNGFASLPVLSGGRLKPLDTVARSALLSLRGKQTVRVDGRAMTAREWLLDMLFRADKADQYKVFTIDDPDVLGVMGLEQTTERYFSFADMRPHMDSLQEQVAQAQAVKTEQRNRYQRAMAALGEQLVLYQRLQNTLQMAGEDKVAPTQAYFMDKLVPAAQQHAGLEKIPDADLRQMANQLKRYQFIAEASAFLPAPELASAQVAAGQRQWVSMGQAMIGVLQGQEASPAVTMYAVAGDAYRQNEPAAFNRVVTAYRSWLKREWPNAMTRSGVELVFNAFEPFYQAMVLNVVVFILAAVFWLLGRESWRRAAWQLLIVAFVVHTIGLVTRMILQGRPPVTNLYSSAIFVGWAAVGLGLVLERWYRNAVGIAVAAVIGFTTLIIAHHLMTQGDTLEMMRAVLDSNFWLATHVVCITLGYSSTFLTGTLAAMYLLRRWLDRGWSAALATNLYRMVFGVLCFSLFFSFLGTVLGGIWADQSWGRFWGWDPKENGALMIVLWNAFVLHARLGRLVGDRGTMVLAVFGNVVTAFSWFGVNMLGIGLHSYGFMDKAFSWLVVFSLSQLAIMGCGFIAERSIRSRR